MLSEQAREKIREQISRYPDSRSALGQALYIAQQECGGWVPPDAVRDVADELGLEPADVQSTMSFYTMYHKVPVGKYIVEICHNIACAINGSQNLFRVMEEDCGIHAGETSKDGLFTLKAVECLAGCGGACTLQLNGLYHFQVTPERLRELLARCRTENGAGESIYSATYAPEKVGRDDPAASSEEGAHHA